jgi:histidinol dehydrogenase
VGIYVPGGKAAYPSVLMNAIPAHVAGVARSSWWCPPPRREEPAGAGRRLCGRRDRAFTIGGAQAVAALAYGTATVPKVDKITGPGNAYVASAKRRVFGTVGIDMIAGPSEILVLADGTTPPDWVAMDLFSQAEHDELAQSILLCPDAAYIDAVQRRDRPPAAHHAAPPSPSLEGRGALIHTAHGRGLRDQQPHRARAPGSLQPSRTAGSRCSSTPAPSSWAPTPAKAWATTAPAPTTCCPPRHRALLLAAGRVRLPEAQQPDRGQRRRADPGPIAAELAYGEGLQGHARAAELRLKNRAERA